MIVIADCGSTKCDWAIVEKSKPSVFFQGKGFNPAHNELETIITNIMDAISVCGQDVSMAEAVYFYGAGCTPGIQTQKVTAALAMSFPTAKISVESDMLGAARAIFKNDDGIACILGTGSNSCIFKNDKIVDNIPAMGYLLGDEGSGAAIGRKLVNAIYKRELPDSYREMFEKECNTNYNEIVTNVYSGQSPATYLAQFVPFVKFHIEDILFRNLVFCEFDLFMNRNIIRYPKYKTINTGFVGSVATEFREILGDAARFHNVTITTVIRQPIERLAEYHEEFSLSNY